ncbi:MAG: LysM peptidoglycan-binding domain-containing protein [Bacteroidota bacterium]
MINQPEVPCPGGFVYTIQAGDTLFALAQRYGTTVQAILAANPGLDPNRLFIGQRICIPVPPAPACPGGFFYTVQAGDTLFAIAQRFGTTVQAILAANPGLDPNRLVVGQRICIPVPQPPACPGGFFYTVQAGDTLFTIAQRFGTTVQAILAANPGLDPNRLVVGQRICIPVPAPPTCPGFIYTVQAGDFLFALANRFNTTVPAILAANPGLNPNAQLIVGQRICIPVPAPPTCPGFIHTIAAGETLFALAARFGTTVQAILAANPGLDPSSLQVGRRICIPVPRPTTAPASETEPAAPEFSSPPMEETPVEGSPTT